MGRPPEVDRLNMRSRLLAVLRERAANGGRCPTRWELPEIGVKDKNLMTAMAREGWFKIEVGGRNLRVVEIDGMRTAAPEGWKPIYSLGKGGKVLAQ